MASLAGLSWDTVNDWRKLARASTGLLQRTMVHITRRAHGFSRNSRCEFALPARGNHGFFKS